MANPKKALLDLQRKYGVRPDRDDEKEEQASRPASSSSSGTGGREPAKSQNEVDDKPKTRAKSAMENLKKKFSEDPKAWSRTYTLDDIRKGLNDSTAGLEGSEREVSNFLEKYGATHDDIYDKMATKYGASQDDSGKYMFSDQASYDSYLKEADALGALYDTYNSNLYQYNDWYSRANKYRTNTLNSTDSELAELKAKLEEARAKENAARLAVTEATNDLRKKKNGADITALHNAAADAWDERVAIERQIEQIEYINKYKDKTYEDNFFGQFQANRVLGRMGQDTSKAYNAYLNRPTEENKKYAEAMDLLTEHFQIQNETALDDENAKATWITKDLAQHLPQRWDQVKAGAGGAVAGGLVGTAFAPGAGTVTGAKVGATAAVGVQSYNQMRGAAFRELLALGVDEETARAAANDEGVVSALIEMADTGWTLATLGTGKLLTALGKGGLKTVAGEAAEGGAKKLLKYLGKYGVLDVIQETAEEGSQQAVSIANRERAQQGNTGIWNLVKETGGTAWDAATGKDPDARDEIVDAGLQGGKLALMMGGIGRVTDYAIETGIRSHIGKKYSEMGGDVVNAMIESGLESADGTESRKLAEKLKAKQQAGKTISNAEVGALQQANVEAIEAETVQATQSPQETLENLARETVSQKENVQQAQPVQRETVPFNVMAENNPVRQQRIAESRAMQRKLGYGEEGMKAFNEILESGNETADQVRSRFQSAYEAGMTNLPREKVQLLDNTQESAYNAGRMDAIKSMKKAETHGATVWGKEGGLIQNEYSSKLDATTADTLQKIGQATGTKIIMKDQVFGGLANGSYKDGTVTIAADAKNPYIVVAKHEVTHRMQDLAPKQYTAYRDYAVQLMAGSGSKMTLVEQYQNRAARDDVYLTAEAAMDEIAADFTEKILTDEKALNDFISHTTKSRESRTMGQKFFQAVREFINKVKRIFKGNKAKMDQAAQEQYGTTIEQLEKAEQLWKEAYMAAEEKAKGLENRGGQEYNGSKTKLSMKNENALTDDELASVHAYKSGGSYLINARLYSGMELDGYYTQMRDNLDTALEKLPAYTGKVYRNLGFDDFGGKEAMDAFLAQHEVGVPVRYGAYSSSSKVADGHPIDGEYVVNLEIESVTGRDMEGFGNNFEDEVLFGRKAWFIPTKITVGADGRPLIVMKEAATNGTRVHEGRDGRYSGRSDSVQQRAGAAETAQVEVREVRAVHAGNADLQAVPGRHPGGDPGRGRNLSEVSEENVRYSLVTDKETLDFLNGQKLVKVYRAMQEIDGKLYPPMAALIKGEGGKKQLVESTKKGAWYQADEHPELIKLDKNGKPKFELNKGNGGMVPAAYNPYFHTSASPLNDQFSSAYDRPNIVVVEGYIPESELTSGYKAQYAKDSVGETAWHAGPVASKLKGAKARRVFLSRWFKAERVVPVDEVAKTIAKTLQGENVSVPWNVVTPSLREALEKQGVEIDYKDVKMGNKVVSFDSTQYSLKDSKGNALTQEQAEFFKDSKVRDENGNLLVMYHGTKKGGFTVFQNKRRPETEGFYFTNDKKYSYTFEGRKANGQFYPSVKEGIEAGTYNSQRYEVYLDVKNPLVLTADQQEIIEDIGYWKNIYDPVKKAGYDGVMMEDKSQVFVFSSNQIKQVDNKNPTSDPDIRFSLKDSEGRELSEGQREYFKDSKARDAQGNLLTLYHGTRKGGFTTFRDWAYLTASEDYAKRYADKDTGETMYEVYANITKPFDTRLKECRDLWRKEFFGSYSRTELQENGLPDWTDGYDLAEWIEENDYDFDAILLDEGADYDHNGNVKERGISYVVRSSEQIKNVDNLNPTDDRDIRFSLKDGQDVESAGPVNSKAFTEWFGDWRNNPKLASKVVDKDGKPLVVYHGTGTTIEEFLPEFTGKGVDQYGSGFYFTTAKETADGYTTRRLDGKEKPGGEDSPNVIPVYLNIRNPLVVNASEHPHLFNIEVPAAKAKKIIALAPNIMDPEESILGDFIDEYWEVGPKKYMIDQLATMYDWSIGSLEGDIFRDDATAFREAVHKVMGYDGVQVNFDSGEKHFIAWFPNQIKHATENTGAFSSKDNRIKFSLKGQDDLLKQNAKLKEVNQELKAQFKTTKFAKVDKKSLDRFAKQLLKDYQSGADINETREALDKIYTYMANGENGESAVWEVAYERAYEAAVEVLGNASTMNDELFQAYKTLRDDLKNTGISINKMYDHDLIGYESINEFRKANFGRIKITNDGIPVDVFYRELSYRYPEFFDEDVFVSQPDQLSHLEEVLDSLQPTEVNPYSNNMREAATWLANDLMERFFELPQAKPTFADKAERKLTRQVIKDAEKLERLREQKNERIAQLIDERREKVKEVTKKEREKRDQKIREIKDHYREKETKAGQSRKARELRAKIERHAQELSRTLLHPTDKHHIPEGLRAPVAELLDAINMESQYTIDPETGKRQKNKPGDPTRRTKAFRELQKFYKNIAQDDGSGIVVDPEIDAMLDLVIDLEDVKLVDMDYAQLADVWQVLRAMEHAIHTAGRMLSEGKYLRTVEWAEDMHHDAESRRVMRGKRREGIRLDLENPYTYFSHYGEAGQAVFRMLRDAQDQQQMMVEEVRDKVQAIVSPKTVRKLENETHVVNTERGDRLTLTTAQIMDFYLLTKREQARDHILKGGIVQPEVKAKKIQRGTDAILLTAEDLLAIVGKLDDKQRQIADKLQELTRTTLADYGNKASMKAYGYKKFTGDDYWPIKSAREGVHSNVEKGGNNTRSIKNIGLAKNVMPHASNPLDLGGVFQTFASHAADMTDYAAWLCPMEDVNRLYNFQFKDEDGNRTGETIKGLLDRVGGKGAQQYWHNLMEDIQNGIKAPKDTAIMGPIRRMYGNVKGASVAWNIRVIVQQPTAIIRAAAVLSPEAMLRGMFVGGGWKAAVKHSPIAKRKDMGGFDISSPMQMNEILFDSKDKLQRFNEIGTAGAAWADRATWGRIWNACESEVKFRGEHAYRTDEFYEAVNRLFTEVIDQSQVVDGVLQRSQAMRSNDALANMATAFMGEPTMALNMMLRAYDSLVNETDKNKRGKAIKAFGRTAFVLLVTNAVNALAQSLIDAARDDEDEEYWEKFLTAFTGITGDEKGTKDKALNAVLEGNLIGGINPVGYIPFVKDLLSIMSGYSVQRADAAVMEDIYQAGKGFFDSWLGDGKKTKGNSLLNLAKQVSKVWGIGVGNLTRDVYAALRAGAIETGNIPAQYELEKWIYKINNDGNRSRFVDILYKAYQTDKDSFDKLYAEMLKDDHFKSVNDAGEVTTTSDYIASKLKPKLVDDLFDLYKNDKAAYEEMYDDLVKRDFLKTGVKSSDPDKDTFVSTADAIASAMESRMKKDQGVKKVSDLEQRYLSPSQQPKYDGAMSEISRSDLWKSATEKEREALEEKLYGLVTESAGSAEMREDIRDGAEHDLDETEYLMYTLALDMFDQPNENGNTGTYNTQERADAILALNVGDRETAYLWSLGTTSDEVFDALSDGVDMEKYIAFKGGLAQLEPGVDYKKGNTESRKRAIKQLLSEIGLNSGDSDYRWLYHTEYKK